MENKKHVLEVKNLKISYYIPDGEVQALRGVSFHLFRGETLGIVGESGSGKSVTALSIMGLIPSPPGSAVSGSINYDGKELTCKPEKQMQKLRGKEISMIFQDPSAVLNPVISAGRQIIEVLMIHQRLPKKEARAKSQELLDMVGLNWQKCFSKYPHELSGGMCQRVMLAIALACNPSVLIADEPTTALDVTIQRQIMVLLKDLSARMETSVLFFTHDLSLVYGFCSRVLVMYAGQVVEEGPVQDIFNNPCHPYLKSLLKSAQVIEGKVKGLHVPAGRELHDSLKPPSGCAYAPRCKFAVYKCSSSKPGMYMVSRGHFVSCWLSSTGEVNN